MLHINSAPIKKVKKIARWLVGLPLGIYLAVVALLNIPAVQRSLSIAVSSALEDALDTEVRIGRIGPGLFNRLVVDDLVLCDHEGNDLFKASRLSATFQILPLFRGKMVVDNIRLFSFSLCLLQEQANEPPNYQFLTDLLSSDKPSDSFVDLRINSILLRRGQLSHELRYAPHDSTRFSPAHLFITNLNADLSIKALRSDSVDIAIKKLGFEENSGLQIKKLSGRLTANRRQALLSGFALQLPHSTLKIDTLQCNYKTDESPSPFAIRKETIKYFGRIAPSILSPTDFRCFAPILDRLNTSIHLSASLQGTSQELNVKHLNLRTADNDLNILLTTHIERGTTAQQGWDADAQVYDCTVQSSFIRQVLTAVAPDPGDLTTLCDRLKFLSYHGTASHRYGESTVDGTLQCGAGQLVLSALLNKRNGFDAHLQTRQFDVGSLLTENAPLGLLSLNIQANGQLQPEDFQLREARIKGTVEQMELLQYDYRNVNVEAHYADRQWQTAADWDDLNGRLSAALSLNTRPQLPVLTVDAQVYGFSPHNLKLTSRYDHTRFDGRMKASLQGDNMENLAGNITLTDFRIQSPEDSYNVSHINLQSRADGRTHKVTLESDFASATLEGTFDFGHLGEEGKRHIHPYLPSLISLSPTLPRFTHSTEDMRFAAEIRDCRPLQKLFDIPLNIEQPAHLSGCMENLTGELRIDGIFPALSYGDEHLQNIRLSCSTTPDSLFALLSADRIMQGNPVSIGLQATATNDHLLSVLSWNNNKDNVYRGRVATDTRFFKDEAGRQALSVQFAPTNLIINDSLWHIHASSIELHNQTIEVNRFLVNQGDRQLSINGRISQETEDTLTVKLKDINLQYVFDIINFHSVEFGGHATGNVYANGLMESPQMDARLNVRQFTFNEGNMGDMDVHGWWNKNEKSIFLDARMRDLPNSSETHVEGSVTPGQGPGTGLDLHINTQRINLYFLNEYTSGIFTNLQGRATGWARVFGPFKEIDLEGDLVIEEADMTVNTLNTHYRLENDTVNLTPGIIALRNAKVFDHMGGRGRSDHNATVNGVLRHNHFSNLTYDINVQANNVLGYDHKEFGDEVFCGTAYATGLVRLNGKPGELNVDIQARPERGTQFVYNSSTPETLTDKEFIRFVSPTDSTRSTYTDNSVTATSVTAQPTDIESDMHINFNLDITPEATVKILMDARAGDYIALNGYSNLRATYYNKGKFQMYGTFRVDHGVYKLSLQDVIRKDFQFKPGGTLTFGGEPYQADLNLQAVYTVPSVSLNDLSSGSTFSQNNVRVNCIMNLGGKAQSPQVSFDFDLPNVNEDEKQMVRSLISTDEEKNMQIIYLLGIGRFYTYDYNNPDQSQSSVAMKSLLSTTLSGQLNQMLSSIVGSSNWNIGTNLSTGDTGWSDMDVEGLLSGRLLNNRLLINGNFGYRENTTNNSNFIGDFDLQWLLTRNGNVSLKAYSETNERYFTKSTLTTQGIGLMLKKDFISWKDLFRRKNRKP
ncbi:MAG: translocation/assembly module TamB [Clostridium sp.]|nr:translocation/assembly module TamB [Clostridium sp.]